MGIRDSYKYSSVDVAKYIVARANKEKLGINITKVQKLLYIAYGAYLVACPEDGRLTDEHPQAWPFGPVFPTTRNRLLKIDLRSIDINSSAMSELNNDELLSELITFVFKGFGTWDASQLTQWSHKPQSPWDKTVSMEGFKWGMQIPDEYILPYFTSIINVKQ